MCKADLSCHTDWNYYLCSKSTRTPVSIAIERSLFLLAIWAKKKNGRAFSYSRTTCRPTPQLGCVWGSLPQLSVVLQAVKKAHWAPHITGTRGIALALFAAAAATVHGGQLTLSRGRELKKKQTKPIWTKECLARNSLEPNWWGGRRRATEFSNQKGISSRIFSTLQVSSRSHLKDARILYFTTMVVWKFLEMSVKVNFYKKILE